MMSKSKTPPLKGLRVLWVLPLVCLAIGLQAQTVYDPTGKGNEKLVITVPGGTQNGNAVALELTVTADRKVKNDSFTRDLDGFGETFREMIGNMVLPEISVLIKAEPNVPQSYIDELKAELRKAGLLKVSHRHE